MSGEIPQWAVKRACDLASEMSNGDRFDPEFVAKNHYAFPSFKAFAAYITAHEEPPGDPLLIEARALCSDRYSRDREVQKALFAGKYDDHSDVKLALAALRRGFEVGKEPS